MTTKPDTSEIPTPESDFHKLVDNFNGSKPVLISGSEIVTYKFACSLEKQLHLANLEKERLAADLKLLEDSIHFLGESSHRSGDCIKIIRKLSEELSQLKQAKPLSESSIQDLSVYIRFIRTSQPGVFNFEEIIQMWNEQQTKLNCKPDQSREQ